MCVTDCHDMALAAKVALNPITTNQPSSANALNLDQAKILSFYKGLNNGSQWLMDPENLFCLIIYCSMRQGYPSACSKLKDVKSFSPCNPAGIGDTW